MAQGTELRAKGRPGVQNNLFKNGTKESIS